MSLWFIKNYRMKYTPKELHENVNVSHTSPVRELFLLLGGLLGILIVMYVVLGFAVELVVMRMPPNIEQHFGSLFSGMFAENDRTEADDCVQQLLDALVEQSSLPGRYVVHIIPSSQANALALPGGHIVVLSGLLNKLKSENELSFILAHELGHFAARDHLKGFGRGLVLTTISAFWAGVDNSLTQFLMRSLMSVEMRFSQRQETAADLYGLDLLKKRYGHIGGATAFFQVLATEEAHGRLAYFFATHPYPQDRVDELRRTIEAKGYPSGEKTALDPRITTIPESSESKSFKDILGF